jgi:hypothetical protein
MVFEIKCGGSRIKIRKRMFNSTFVFLGGKEKEVGN